MNYEVLNYALNYLKTPHTRYELETKLKGKKYEGNDISEVIDYLTVLGYIDDEKYTELYIDYYLSVKGDSKKMVFSKLIKKGVDKSIISKILEEYAEYSEVDAVLKIIGKKFKSVDLSDKVKLMKIKKYLINKGFSIQAIDESIKKLI
ncbi:regulatory protein RecX [Calorimonas adulescens]|uniref:Regulatory protein RecX n=1 Tax=Calorimonas adulescens TaxID=2606906 RepID=A0A5D8QBZ5_9THEO|nr:regulatory protein RecX [Calorimonas adulescens]TZE82042.1 regulatory protein RecX [Calorimonas adulescens]